MVTKFAMIGLNIKMINDFCVCNLSFICKSISYLKFSLEKFANFIKFVLEV